MFIFQKFELFAYIHSEAFAESFHENCSSIEHGGMSTVFYMVEQFDSMRVRDHFPICRNFCVGIFFGIFCWIFCVTILWYFCVGLLVVGGGYMVPLAYDNGMLPRCWEQDSRHRTTPLMQTSISVVKRGWGFPAPLQGQRPKDIGH